MFDQVNLEKALHGIRKERLNTSEQDVVLSEVKSLFEADWEKEQNIYSTLTAGAIDAHLPEGHRLDESRIFAIEDIKKLCIKYRLRFLSTKHFEKPFPQEAIQAIKQTEKLSEESITAFMIAAPASMFKLSDVNKDPLLFAPLADGRFYLIHQWGGDMSAMRSVLYWPLAKLSNLLITVVLFSFLLSAVLPTAWLSPFTTSYFNFYRVAFFVWNIAFFSGMISYFWFATHQKFSVHAWNSKYFN